jgi:hypothetical protein
MQISIDLSVMIITLSIIAKIWTIVVPNNGLAVGNE